MLNEVRIFEVSVFNTEFDSNFTNSKLDSRNLNQGFTARSYDLARPPGVAPPLTGGLSATSFHVH